MIPMPRDTPHLVRLAGALGAAGTLIFVAIVTALHWLRPEISFIENYVSDYANGRWGVLFSVSSFAHGLGNLVVAVGLWLLMSRSSTGRLGAVLFGISAVGVLIAATFSTDPRDVPATLSGETHLFAAFSSFTVEAGALCLLALAFARLPGWRSFAPVTVALMALGSVSLAVLLIFRATGMSPGIAERVALTAFVGWELLAALRLAGLKIPSTVET